MEQPIVNPPNPYVGTLRLFPGTLVKISGRVRPNASRFAVNFQTGPSLNPRDDLALHLSPCFGPVAKIIRNSLIDGVWGNEESWGDQMLAPNQAFEIMILAEPTQFKIAINGRHYCEFRHRIAFEAVTNLTADGDVDLDRIAITNMSTAPSEPAPPRPVQPSSAPHNVPPYPVGPQIGMPMPPNYPTLPGGGPVSAPGPYPTMPVAANYPPQAPPAYMPAYPTQQPPAGPYPSYPAGQVPPAPPGAYPQANPYGHPGAYPPGYQQDPRQQQQPGSSSDSGASNSIFGALPINGKAMGLVKGLVKEGIHKKFPLTRHFL